jgi:hypothetical protein
MQTFTTSTVRYAFKHCGLWPFNPEVTCEHLRLDDGPDLVVYDRGKEYELPEWDFDHSRPVEEGGVKGDPETPTPFYYFLIFTYSTTLGFQACFPTENNFYSFFYLCLEGSLISSIECEVEIQMSRLKQRS